jgi:hypothetical protein
MPEREPLCVHVEEMPSVTMTEAMHLTCLQRPMCVSSSDLHLLHMH